PKAPRPRGNAGRRELLDGCRCARRTALLPPGCSCARRHARRRRRSAYSVEKARAAQQPNSPPHPAAPMPRRSRLSAHRWTLGVPGAYAVGVGVAAWPLALLAQGLGAVPSWQTAGRIATPWLAWPIGAAAFGFTLSWLVFAPSRQLPRLRVCGV